MQLNSSGMTKSELFVSLFFIDPNYRKRVMNVLIISRDTLSSI